jgi:hypothetical protein
MTTVITGGLTRYERRLDKSKNKDSPSYRPLHESAQYNAGMRLRKKMLSKSNWFKKKKDDEVDHVVSAEVERENHRVGCVKSTPAIGGGHGKTAKCQPNKNSSHNTSNGMSAGGHDGRASVGNHLKGGGKNNKQAVRKRNFKTPPTISVMFVERWGEDWQNSCRKLRMS